MFENSDSKTKGMKLLEKYYRMGVSQTWIKRLSPLSPEERNRKIEEERAKCLQYEWMGGVEVWDRVEKHFKENPA